MRYAIDSSKLSKELGWSPIPDFTKGLEKTVEWYLANTKWLEGILSGDYQRYYNQMYDGR
jgi:dTDP-glucose 4,6-dehydratase